MPPPFDAILSPANLAAAFIALNFIAFAAFGLDKAAAEGGRRRIAEATLLGWAFIGGTPGAYAGRALFRHKTRKQPFSSALHRIALVQAVALAALGGWLLGGPSTGSG